MSITVDRAALAGALSIAARVAGLRHSIPVAQTVRLEAGDGMLRLSATDFEHWAELSVAAEGEIGPICVHAGRIAELMGAIVADEATISLDDSRLKVTAGRGRHSLAIISASDFPRPEFTAESIFEIDAAALSEAIRFTLPAAAAAEDTTKPGLAGVRFVSRSGILKAVSTDRFNLMMIDVAPIAAEVEATIGTKGLELVVQLMPSGPITVGFTDKAVMFSWLGGSLRSPLLQDPYVPFEKAIADQFTSQASVEAKSLLQAMKAVRPLGQDDRMSRSKRLKLTLSSHGSLSANSPEGEAIEEFPADWDGEGEFVMGLAASRLEKMLRGFGDGVLTLKLNGPLDPFVVEAAAKPDRLGVLFPMYA